MFILINCIFVTRNQEYETHNCYLKRQIFNIFIIILDKLLTAKFILKFYEFTLLLFCYLFYFIHLKNFFIFINSFHQELFKNVCFFATFLFFVSFYCRILIIVNYYLNVYMITPRPLQYTSTKANLKKNIYNAS